MATIYVDGKKYNVNSSNNLLQTCLSLGLDIPYFCWHPALGSVGACRQCAVKQYKNADDTCGHLVMSCMTPASHGSFISIDDKEAKEFRANVAEWLMINHPHDCPVCEEGGSCHLQDMTVMTGHNIRRYRFTKRTHKNQQLGPFISHEMNRCITCYRCVRYYRDYTDGTDFGVYGMHDNIYFGRPKSGILESEFSGNLVEVCPTGVFTDKTHSEHYNRKWDMQFAPSICLQCSVGCNTSPGERYGELRRIENRYNGSVNHYFICDLGRFSYGYVNLKNRPRQPQQRLAHAWITLDAECVVQTAADIMHQTKKTIGIGSARASLESNFALLKLVGIENFYTGIAEDEQSRLQLMLTILRESGIHTPALREMESYDAVLVLGEDITQTAARIALAVRQAVKGKAYAMAAEQKVADWQISAVLNIGQNAKYPLFITNVDNTRLDDIAVWSYCAPVDEQARLGFAIAHGLDALAPEVSDLANKLQVKVDIIVEALASAKKPLIISGSSAGSEAIIAAAANIAKALQSRNVNVGISFVSTSANSFGLAIMGGGSLDQALKQLTDGTADSVILLENDLYRHALTNKIDKALKSVKNILVLDHRYTTIMDQANLILPAASFAESDGTIVNQEGRAQRFFRVYDPAYYDLPDKKTLIQASWRWLYAIIAVYHHRPINWAQLDDVIQDCITVFPQLQGIVNAAPDATFRIYGQKIARSPHRYSGRTAILADINVHEPRQPQDIDTSFAFSMEGNSGPLANYQQIPFAWAPGWNSSQAWNKFQAEVGGALRFGDPGVRLIEASTGNLSYFDQVPIPFHPVYNSWVVAPYYHLFGSEETSQCVDVIQQRMPDPYLMVHPEDAAQLGLTIGTLIDFNCAGQKLRLPLRYSKNLAQGQVGLPLGFPGIPPVLLGKRVEDLRKAII